MKQEISDGHGVMNVIYKLYVYNESNKKREKERKRRKRWLIHLSSNGWRGREVRPERRRCNGERSSEAHDDD